MIAKGRQSQRGERRTRQAQHHQLAPIMHVCQIAGRQREEQHGYCLCEADQTERERLSRSIIDLPPNSQSLRGRPHTDQRRGDQIIAKQSDAQRTVWIVFFAQCTSVCVVCISAICRTI